jgi:hypothetical protein
MVDHLEIYFGAHPTLMRPSKHVGSTLGERGVRRGQGPDAVARPSHGRHARRAVEAAPRRGCEGVHSDRFHRARGVVPAVRGEVPAQHRGADDEALA